MPTVTRFPAGTEPPPPSRPDNTLTLEEAAQLAGYSTQKIRDFIAWGMLTATRQGVSIYVDRASLEAALAPEGALTRRKQARVEAGKGRRPATVRTRADVEAAVEQLRAAGKTAEADAGAELLKGMSHARAQQLLVLLRAIPL